MTGAPDGTDQRYGDCTDWLIRGPYNPYIDAPRTVGGVTLVRGKQPPGHYPDPPFRDYSLICTTAGRCWTDTDFGCGRKRVEIVPGMMIVAPTGTACDYEKHGPSEQLVLGLPKARVAELAEQATGRPVADLGECHHFFRDQLVETLCVRMWDEAASGNPHGALFADHALGTIVAALLTRAGRPPKELKRPQVLSSACLERVLSYVADNLGESITLADLAGVAHLSEFHFARLFKRATGLAPHQYVIAQRVERASALIREGKLSLAAVATTVGFAHQSHLNRHFKRIVGCTPVEYRK